jgi:uncharacterized lipoprotein
MKFKLNSLVVVLGLAACSLSAQAQQTVDDLRPAEGGF